jgi:hypothetical protein
VIVIATILLWLGVAALFVGWLGIAFCGFQISFLRGIRNLILPFVAFGDAYNSFPFLLWIWGGGVAIVALGALLAR